MPERSVHLLTLCLILLVTTSELFANDTDSMTEREAMAGTARRPASDEELKRWLQNMVWYHGFQNEEIMVATGLSKREIDAAQNRFRIFPDNRPRRPKDAPLLVLPYPGGRHPRIGFLDGAIRPQRETKVSVFTPWDDTSYVVADIPEAIWSNLGLTYLAHIHVDTIWTERGITLPTQEWQRQPDGTLVTARKLPNGIEFRTSVHAHRDHVAMTMWLKNGTTEPLSNLRVQNCVMLRNARGFSAQTNANKVNDGPYIACHDDTGKRWIITAWHPLDRTWANPSCPCLHSDPKFADCPPGQTRELRGWLSFYEGENVHDEFRRIEMLNWKNK